MKQSILLTALLLTAALTANAQLFWKIEGNGMKSPSYLYGTFHLLCPEDFELDSQKSDALENCDQLVLELDLSDPNVLMASQFAAFMKDEHNLREYLSEEDYNQMADSVLAKTGMPLALLSGMKPLMVASVLYPSVLGCTPISPEMRFAQFMKERNKTVLGLEEVEEQMRVFDSIPYQLQADMLKEYILTPSSMIDETEGMLKAYLEGDLEQMVGMVAEGEENKLAAYDDILLNDRNERWIARIENMILEKPTFIAVGAAHLGGSKGVIELLRKEGYVITPVVK